MIRTAATLVLVGAAPVLSGCGGDNEPPVYSKESVCGVAVDAVEGVMGTNKFTANEVVTRSTADRPPAPRGGDLPLSSGSGGITKMECDVRTTEDAPSTTFTFSLTNGVDADDLIKAINASAEKFDVQGGVATTSFTGDDHSNWRWACTAPSDSSTPTAGGSFGREDATAEQRRALVDAVAVAAGCPAEDPSTS
ncbi:hypothetical protein [Nocardioides sp. NPDC047086]|uniref:hypothetical protein n=1 Tax=Nocardioides sp. NPDC047086 TaxID=3154810 RepID=UPI0033CA0F6E